MTSGFASTHMFRIAAPRWWASCWGACVVAVLGICSTSACAESSTVAVPPPAMELQPYQIRVFLAFDGRPSFTRRFRQETVSRLDELCERYWGQMCRVNVEQTERLFPRTQVGLGRLSAEQIPGFTTDPSVDKTYILTVESSGLRYQLAGRVWDAASQQASRLLTTDAYQRREIADRLFQLVGDLFESVVIIDDFDSKSVSLRIRAGELPPGDPDQVQLQPDRLLQPFYRFYSRQMELQRVQTIPWTYFVVTETKRARAKCEIISGLRIPLTSRRRRRIEPLAIGVRPHLNRTELKLVSQHEPTQPLTGLAVDVVTDPAEDPLRLVSKRDGTITITGSGHSGGSGLQWLYVRSGKTFLAKLPFIAGLSPTATVQLPDDSVRLRVEGRLSALEADIIATVAQRAVISSRARSLARAERWEQVDQQLQLIDKLPGPNKFQTDLTVIREPALSEAEAQKSRSATARIRRLCERTSELISQYLDPNKIRIVKDELADLREAISEETR